MTRFLAAWILAAGLAVASDLDFHLVNATGRSFEAVYVSAANDSDWDGNLLPDRLVLAPGKSVEVKFPSEAPAGTWDLKLVDDEGLVVRFQGVRLEGADHLTITETAGRLTISVE